MNSKKRDNLESQANFESTGENRIKTNKNNDKGNISPVLQKDESLVGGLDYSTSTDENNVIRTSENNSLSSEGKKELTNNAEESSLNKQQNEDDVEIHANFELTEENRIQTNKNNDTGNISPVQQKDETVVDDLEYSTSTDENSVIRTSQNNLLSSEGNKELINNTEENSLIKQQNEDNVENHANFESIGENVVKSNENTDNENISPVEQKDEA